MNLTLEEAATRLGKSVRQVRYLIEHGQLRAKKIAGRWFVELAALDAPSVPQKPEQQEAAARKQARLRAAVEDALEPDAAPARRYSVSDLKAFVGGAAAYRTAMATFGADHDGCRRLREALMLVARGCHRFEPAAKAEAFRAARDAASDALCLFLLDGNADGEAVGQAIETELLPALAGLLRRTERRRQR